MGFVVVVFWGEVWYNVLMLDWLLITSVFAQTENISVPEPSLAIIESIDEEQEKKSSFVSVYEKEYSRYRETVEGYLPEGDYCALFVNRMFLLRYNLEVYGNAWTMQLHPQNQQWMDLKWKLSEEDFNRSNRLALFQKEDRIKHYTELYDVLDNEKDPVGVAGFVYHYSIYKDELAQSSAKKTLAQTHVAHIAGRKLFSFVNESTVPKTLESVLVEKYGTIHDYEKEFIERHVRLNTLLQPNDEYFYTDYLVEENFKGVIHGSLLELVLRKHRNNKITPLLRPVSYSQVKDEVRDEVGAWN